MIAIRLWCLLALLSVARCDSGDGLAVDNDDDEGASDDDDFMSGNEMSGAGYTLQNTTAVASTTVVDTQTTTTTTRLSTKAVVTTKSPLITQLVQQLTTTTVAIEDNDDDDSDPDTDPDDEADPEDADSPNPAVNNQPEQTTLASIEQNENEDEAPERTTTVSQDLFQYVWSQPGIVAGLIGGAVLGVLFAILLTLFVIYRLRRRNDRTYRKGGSRGSQDETGAFWFDEEDGAAIAYSRASAERYPPHGHVQQPGAGAYVNPQTGTLKAAGANTLRGSQMLTLPPGMGPQAQPLLYTAPMAPNAQNSYEEYMANLYNQQMYGGYLQQKA